MINYDNFFEQFKKLELPPLHDTIKPGMAFRLIHINKTQPVNVIYDNHIKLIHDCLPCPVEKLTKLAEYLLDKNKLPIDIFWRIYFWILLSDQRLKLIYLMRTRNAETRFGEKEFLPNCNALYKTLDMLEDDDIDEDEYDDAYSALFKKKNLFTWTSEKNGNGLWITRIGL